MRKISKIVVNNGKLFDTEQEARKYLDKAYADILCKISHNIVSAGKYGEIAEYINNNLSSFQELIQIREDMNLENWEDAYGRD